MHFQPKETRKYNKAIGGQNKAIGRHNKDADGQPYCIDEQEARSATHIRKRTQF